MTNRERQESMNKKYKNGTEVRGCASWCSVCKHKMPKAGCRKKASKVTEDCDCATSYNRMRRTGGQ